MLPASFSTCGIPYEIHEDGRVSVQGQLLVYDSAQIKEKLGQIWANYGGAILTAAQTYEIPPAWLVGIIYIESGGKATAASACEEKFCPGLWKQGLCAEQGGPEKYCAGGLMQFTSGTAKMFGKNLEYYMSHPGEMILDAANLITVGGPNGRAYGGGVRGRAGDILSVVKMYNGGNPCGGGGLTGHGGQADYVSKFLRACNTFMDMNLAPAKTVGSPGLITAAFVAIGALGYNYADEKYEITQTLVDKIRSMLK